MTDCTQEALKEVKQQEEPEFYLILFLFGLAFCPNSDKED